MANALDDAEGLTGLLVMLLILGIIVWLIHTVFSFFGGASGPNGPMGPSQNPLSKLNNLTTNLGSSFAGNPQDPGYNFFYGPNAWTWSSLGDWIAGKAKETVSSDPYAGQDNWDWNPDAANVPYVSGSNSQLDSELQPW
jgi:hypothetical protein